MNSVNTQMNNISFQLKNLDMQFDSIKMQMQNMVMQNLSPQLQNLGIQMLNLGIQIINVSFDFPDLGFSLPNLRQQINNIGNEIQKIGMNIDMKNGMQINMNMNMQPNNINFMPMNPMMEIMNNNYKQNMEGNNNHLDKISLFFERDDTKEKTSIGISMKKTVEEAINLYRIKSGDKEEKRLFFYNGQRLNPNKTIFESGLIDGSNILVVKCKSIIG